MKCDKCGKELIFIGKLSEQQVIDLKYIEAINSTISEESLKMYEKFDGLSDENILACLTALGTLRSKSEFLFYKLKKELKENYSLSKEQFNHIHIINYQVYCI